MTMRERVARAINERFRQLQPRPDDWPTWGELLAQGHQGYHRVEDTRALADAALATLETPDEGMVEAGAKVFGSHFAGAETARTTFVAMIRSIREATP